MNIEMINQLINKFKSIKKSEKLNYKKISDILGITFSQEFRKICNEIGFDYFGLFEWFNSQQVEEYSIIGETLNLRNKLKLPHDTLFLASDGVSLLFMKCFGDHEEIYWIAIEDVERFCKGQRLECNYDFFPTFIDFLNCLLKQEEDLI